MPGEKIAFTKTEFEKVVHDPNAITPKKWKAILRCGCAVEQDEKGVLDLIRVGNRCPSNENGHRITTNQGSKA